jgi:hypothetical protein
MKGEKVMANNKQPIKKKSETELSGMKTVSEKLAFMKDYKSKNNLNDAKDKELEWIIMPEAFQEALKIPGIPKGYFSATRGLPNSGKSTMKLHLIAACQKQGVLPVIYETENNFPWDHARLCGMEFEDVVESVIDEETGELIEKVVDHEGFFIFMDTAKLFEKYGCFHHAEGVMKTKPTRDTAVIEDIPYSIECYLEDQKEGKLPFDMCFIWDSVGSIRSFRSAISKVNNNQWDAGALSISFNTIVNDRIPSSKKENSPYTNTLFVVNKIWIDGQSSPGAPIVRNKGGESFAYGARLLIHMGGVVSAGVKSLEAESKGVKYRYGTQTKIAVEKNQVNDITYKGVICCTPHGFWSPDKLQSYLKEHKNYLLDRLENVMGVTGLDDDSEVILTVGEKEE